MHPDLTPAEQPKEYRQARFRRPPGSTELLLVRHGESEPLVPGRPFPLVDGHGDPGLAHEGHEQAERIAERLAGHPIDAIYVSTLRRTAETAAPLAARLGIEPTVERDLREVNLGIWEGELYRKHMAEAHPIAQQLMREQRWDAIPGAESAESISTRVRGALDRIVAAHPSQCVAIFSHGGIICEILVQAAEAGRPFAFIGASNGSISQVVASGERWILRRFNDTSHLTGDLDRAPDLSPVPELPGTNPD
jgi:2,3-bisphosphoglycerate-dependent phosphoglycerate mutase